MTQTTLLTREQVQNIQVGDYVSENWNTRDSIPLDDSIGWTTPTRITRIYASGIGAKGHAYTLGYREFGDNNGQISFSAVEGERRIRVTRKS